MAKTYKYRVENKDLIPFDNGYPYIMNESNSDNFVITMPRYYGDIDLSTGTITIWCTPANLITLNSLSVQLVVVTDTTIQFGWTVTSMVTQYPGLVKFWVSVDYGTGVWKTNNGVFVVRRSFVADPTNTEIPSELIPNLVVVGEHANEILVDAEYNEESSTYDFLRMDGSTFSVPVISGGDVDLSEIEAELDNHELRITGLEQEIEQIDISDLETRVTNVETEITNINDDLDTIETNVTQNTTNITTNTNNLTTLTNRVNEIESSELVDTPNDGNIYARSYNEWKQLNTIKGRTIKIDNSSTETKEDGSEYFPIKDTPDNISDIATFGEIIDIAPGTYQGNMNVDVDNITIFTEGATGQYRAQMNGDMVLSAIRTGIANFQILGDITTSADAELVYMTNVDMGSLTYDGSGYSRYDECFIERTLVVNSGTVDLRDCQFESSSITDVVVNGGTFTAFRTSGMNIVRNGGTVTLIDCTMDGIADTSDSATEPLIIVGGEVVSGLGTGIINKTGTSPYILSGTIYNYEDSVFTGTRLEIAQSATDILANRITTHYTPTDNYVTGHLSGIDNSLGMKLESPVGDSTYVRTNNDWIDYKTLENPAGLFVKRNGGPVIEWTSPTTFTFTGGIYIKAATRGTINIVNLTAQNVPYQGGTFITFNPETNELSTLDAAFIISLPTDLYLVGIMGPDNNGNPSVKIFGGEVISYTNDNDIPHKATGSVDASTSLTIQVNDTITATLTKPSATGVLTLNTTATQTIDIRRISYYDTVTAEGFYRNRYSLDETGLVVDDTIYMNTNDSGTVWIGTDDAWYEIKYFCSGDGQYCRMYSNKLI